MAKIKRTDPTSRFNEGSVVDVDGLEFARKQRASAFDDLVEKVKKLAIGKGLTFTVKKGESVNRVRASIAAAMRTKAQPHVKGTLFTRTTADGNVVVCHMPKAAGRAPNAGKRPVTAAKAKAAASRKKTPVKVKRAGRDPAATPAPAAPVQDNTDPSAE